MTYFKPVKSSENLALILTVKSLSLIEDSIATPALEGFAANDVIAEFCSFHLPASPVPNLFNIAQGYPATPKVVFNSPTLE
jgi:hypothetical protein